MQKIQSKFSIVLMIALNVIFIKATGQISTKTLSAIDQLFVNWDGQNPGCAIGIIYQNQLIYEKGWGKEDLEKKIENTSESIFHIASMSKQFIAAGIGLLILEEKLELEDPISKYIPKLNASYQAVTIEHLIHQISGIKDYSNLMFLRGDRTEDFIPIEKGIDLLGHLKALNFEPGTSYSYSNSNYLLLSEIISRVSKMDFKDYIHQKIFAPLDMSSTYFIENGTTNDKRIAIDYEKDRDGNYEEYSGNLMAAEDQILSSIKDLFRWDRNFKTNHVGGEELKSILLQRGKLNNGKTITYAFGLHVDTYNGLKTISHSGDMGGYHSQYLQFPDEELSIVILANASDFNSSGSSYQVVNILLKDKFQTSVTKPQYDNETSIQLSNKELKKFTGDYWNGNSNRPRIIYLRNDTLRYNRPNNYESPIVPVGNNKFRMLNFDQEQSATIEFVFEDKDLRELVFQSLEGEPVLMEKYTYPAYNRNHLGQFNGRFYCEELDVYYEITLQKPGLMVYLNGEKRSSLNAIKADYFTDNYFGDFQFIRDENNQIEGFYLDRERARNMYFSKSDTK